MSPAKRKQQEESLSVQGPFHMGFKWMGESVRRYSIWVVAGLLILAVLGLLGWLAVSFPDRVFRKTQEAVTQGGIIDHKVDDLQKTVKKQGRQLGQLSSDMVKLADSVDALAEKLDSEASLIPTHDLASLDVTAGVQP